MQVYIYVKNGKFHKMFIDEDSQHKNGIEVKPEVL